MGISCKCRTACHFPTKEGTRGSILFRGGLILLQLELIPKWLKGRSMMKKKWQRPVIDERETGLEVTSYMPAELDRK